MKWADAHGRDTWRGYLLVCPRLCAKIAGALGDKARLGAKVNFNVELNERQFAY